MSEALGWFSIVGASDTIRGYLDIWGYKHQYLVKYWKQISGDNGWQTRPNLPGPRHYSHAPILDPIFTKSDLILVDGARDAVGRRRY